MRLAAQSVRRPTLTVPERGRRGPSETDVGPERAAEQNLHKFRRCNGATRAMRGRERRREKDKNEENTVRDTLATPAFKVRKMAAPQLS